MHHITGHSVNHKIETSTGHSFEATSTHHQMCIPNEDGFILGWSKYKHSKYYFGNKDAILMELQRNGFTLLIKDVENKSKQYKTLSERLLQISLCYFDFSYKNQELYELMFNLGVNSKEKPFDLIMQLKKLVLEIILEITDTDSEEIFMNWWAIVHGFVTISFIDLFICDKSKTLEILENSILRFIESLLIKK